MKKKLLMLSAKESEITLILTARNMGYHVITTGNKAKRPGNRYADEYIPFDYSDYDGLAKLIRENDINAVCQGCTDFCAIAAAAVGERVGFKGHDTYENAVIIHEKDAFKEFAKKNKIKTPQSLEFSCLEDALAYDAFDDFPLIVKPTDLAGGVGVSVAYSISEYRAAAEKAVKLSHIGHLVVEPFITGTLHSMSAFLVSQKIAAFGTANDYSFKNRYLTNTGLFPADGWEKAVEVLVPEVERIARLLGLVDGLMHLQYIVDERGEPWIIEMMRRCPGNNFTIPLSESTGINWREWIIRAEAGEDLTMLPPTHINRGYYGYHSVMAPCNGVFSGLEIKDEFKKHIFQIEEWKEPGHVITDYSQEKFASIQYFLKDDEEKKKIIPNINELATAKVMELKQD